MKRIAFLVLCAVLFCTHAAAQITSFNQRGKATQEMTGSGLQIAHSSLPNNAVVKVTNTANGKEIEATVTSRIPASRDRIADLSRGVWDALGLNPDTEIILSITPPPRQRTTEPITPPSGSTGTDLAKTAPSTEPPAEPAGGQSKPASSARENQPASNDDYLSLLRDILIETRQLVNASGPSVITVYPPYPPFPPQSIVTNQPIINNSEHANDAYPQAANTPSVSVSQSNPGLPSQITVPQAMPQATAPVSVPWSNPGPTTQAAPPVSAPWSYPGLPPQTIPQATPPVYVLPKPGLPPQAAPQSNNDCPINPAPQPTRLQIIPQLPNPNGNGIYRLQVGAFCDSASAYALENRLKTAGFNVTRELFNRLHRVIINGIPAAQVQYTAQRLEAMGIKQIWVKQ